MINRAISDVFSLLSKLMDIHGENSFKSKSYANAAFQIDRLPVELATCAREDIAGLKGIGDSTAKKIIEILETGELEALNTLIEKTPAGILELLKIKGIGPKKIATIWHELGIESPGELLYACDENRLIHYKGFGEKSQESIREALEFYFSNQQRHLYAAIEKTAEQFHDILANYFGEENISLTGSFLRQCDIVDELEWVICGDVESVEQTLKELTEISLEKSEEDQLHYLLHEAVRLKIHCVDDRIFDQRIFESSCSSEFLSSFKDAFPNINLNQSDRGIFQEAGLPLMLPCLREDARHLTTAKLNKILPLIQIKDIRGIIHNHSTWSDGEHSIAEMAQACIDRGYEYLVMSDHSVSSFYANGLSVERIKQQQEEINLLNEKLAPFKIFKSIECDILNDGRLDYDDDVLNSFDLVIASVHQNLKMTEERAMQRILTAVQHPAVRILGHASGRLLLSRKGYPLNYPVLIEACKKHDVVLEINANPRRLDIDWTWIQSAAEAGVMLSINPDAHKTSGIDDVRYGVMCAQKGMLTPASNLSSLSLAEFEMFLNRKN
ncbi:MAG: DNA polymerase/3'-5' exonuclease PolX [Chitinophagaceae bacterium]|nr:DNA polymerase/3'-5' exonuclease PolX [Chitinophagaceae bacterium]